MRQTAAAHAASSDGLVCPHDALLPGSLVVALDDEAQERAALVGRRAARAPPGLEHADGAHGRRRRRPRERALHGARGAERVARRAVVARGALGDDDDLAQQPVPLDRLHPAEALAAPRDDEREARARVQQARGPVGAERREGARLALVHEARDRPAPHAVELRAAPPRLGCRRLPHAPALLLRVAEQPPRRAPRRLRAAPVPAASSNRSQMR